MAEKKKEKVTLASLTLFQRRVLGCVNEERRSGEEIHKEYVRNHPQGKIMKVFVPPESVEKVKYALSALYALGLVKRELLSYTYEPLKEGETDTYCLSNEGRSLLPHKSY
jgi:hypothetical protein